MRVKRKDIVLLCTFPLVMLAFYVLSVGPVEVFGNPYHNCLFRPEQEIPEPPVLVRMYYPLGNFCLKTGTLPVLLAYIRVWDWIADTVMIVFDTDVDVYKPPYQPDPNEPTLATNRVEVSESELRSTMAQLLVETDRQAAFDKILSWQRYYGERRYVEKKYGAVGHVVVCPQPMGPPMYAVFDGRKGVAEGGFSLVTSNGEFVNAFLGANCLDPPDVCQDVNGDGIVDVVTDIPCGSHFLVVVPVTPDQTPILAVLFGRGDEEDRWQWRLGKKGQDGLQPIDLRRKRWGWEVVASYAWSRTRLRYEGPEGGPTADFWMFRGPPESSDIEKFVGCGKPKPVGQTNSVVSPKAVPRTPPRGDG